MQHYARNSILIRITALAVCFFFFERKKTRWKKSIVLFQNRTFPQQQKTEESNQKNEAVIKWKTYFYLEPHVLSGYLSPSRPAGCRFLGDSLFARFGAAEEDYFVLVGWARGYKRSPAHPLLVSYSCREGRP